MIDEIYHEDYDEEAGYDPIETIERLASETAEEIAKADLDSMSDDEVEDFLVDAIIDRLKEARETYSQEIGPDFEDFVNYTFKEAIDNDRAKWLIKNVL